MKHSEGTVMGRGEESWRGECCLTSGKERLPRQLTFKQRPGRSGGVRRQGLSGNPSARSERPVSLGPVDSTVQISGLNSPV